jgi:signal-transduction protein with cAMP-binding, CBS, and nucleotidyltransferase domain
MLDERGVVMILNVEEKVQNLSHRDPVFIRADETLRAAASKMWTENVGVLVVGNDHRMLGIISERDVVGRLGRGGDPDTLTVGEVMANHIVSAQPGDPIYEAAFRMLDEEIRHVPVLDAYGQVFGMVSVRDLLRPLLLDALGTTGKTDRRAG